MWVGLLIKFITSLFTGWVGEKERTRETEKAGAQAEAISVEQQAKEKIADAKQTRDGVVDLTADSVRNTAPGTDPDFRD